ncbi:MAG TPA: hypothetical protein VKX96_08725 [Chloroflexota bacterium]|nr:hypothetical protein [Chloroflexota bacterium]
MSDRSQSEPTYFTVPQTYWRDVGDEAYRALSRVHIAIGLALSELERLRPSGEILTPTDLQTFVGSAPPSPAELALQMHEAAGQLLAAVAGEEQDLRQIIGTLRTALAVCWDLYSWKESHQITVAEHMKNLRRRIDDFDQELRTVLSLKSGTMDTRVQPKEEASPE